MDAHRYELSPRYEIRLRYHPDAEARRESVGIQRVLPRRKLRVRDSVDLPESRRGFRGARGDGGGDLPHGHPAYFEIALKTKYSRDDDTSRMLDIIVGSVKFDLAYIYGQELGTPIDRVRGILSSETECQKGFSTLASIETATLTKMEKVMEKFDKLN